MARVFRVGGAVFVGAVLIGVAFLMQRNASFGNAAQAPALVVARGDVRTVQPAVDTDEDGIPDWEEALRGTDPKKYTMLTVSTSTPDTDADTYTPPTTLTGTFSQQFLEHIVRNGAGKTLTADEKAALVQQSIGTLGATIRERLYTQADIKSVATNDLAAVRDYGNALGDIMTRDPVPQENEFRILARATQENNPDILSALDPIVHAYTGMIQNTRALAVPSALAKQHVDLLNALVMVGSDIRAMQEAFSDPMGSLVHIKRYEDDVQGLAAALDAIRITLEQNNITYTRDEKGIFLFSLRP